MSKPTGEISEAVNPDGANNDVSTAALTVGSIQSCIYIVRGSQVLLDRDLAKLYQVETAQLNRQVKRNSARFPEDFMFQLTTAEFNALKCRNGTSSWGGDRRALPHAFTEQGIAMLAGLLRSEAAIKANVAIMRAFVAMRRFLSANAGMFQRIERLEQRQMVTDRKMEQVLQRLDDLAPSVMPEQLFATGCVWDAWDYVSQLIRSARERIVLVDNYVDERVLTLLTKRAAGVSATVHSRYTEQFRLDLEKHNTQYASVGFVQTPHKSHDRFLVIDDDVYLLGASVKDMGKSLCAITKMEVTPAAVLALLR